MPYPVLGSLAPSQTLPDRKLACLERRPLRESKGVRPACVALRMSALPQLPPAQPGRQIMIVRPRRAMVVMCWGIILAVGGPLVWIGASILLRGNLSGLIIAASGLLFAAWIYNSVVGAYLWVDAESVGVSRPLRSASCLKSELDYLLVDNPVSGEVAHAVRSSARTAASLLGFRPSHTAGPNS